MKRRYVHKASPITKDDPVTEAILHVSEILPEDFGDKTGKDLSAEADKMYDEDAIKIMEVLQQLPQGTKHKLIIRMLQAMSNLYRGT